MTNPTLSAPKPAPELSITAGKWKAVWTTHKNGKTGWAIIAESNHELLAEVVDHCGKNTHEANAILMANAPALLRERDELRECVDAFNVFYSQISQLIQGWKNTTPENEWSEWDESVWQELIRLGRKMHDARVALAGEGG